MKGAQRKGIVGAVVCESDAETDAARWAMTRSSTTRKKAQTASQTHQDGRRTAQGGEVVSFTAPLPPSVLRGNQRATRRRADGTTYQSGSVHWSERKRAADEYSERVYDVWVTTSDLFGLRTPWKRAAVEYEWRYAGARPDLDNVARGIKVLQDTLCCCPDKPFHLRPDGTVRSVDYHNRYFLGLIEDDGGIEPVTFRRRKVKTKAEEGVHVTIERVREASTLRRTSAARSLGTHR